jgi:hypothetical protein
VIYEHGEQWWNDINRGKLPIHPPELSGNPTSDHLVAKQEELMKEIMHFALQSYLLHTSKSCLTCRKIQHNASGFTSPPKEGMLRIFIALKIPSPSARF